MSHANPLAHLLELLHRALRSQAFHAPEHPQAVRNMEALAALVDALLAERGAFRLEVAGDGFRSDGRPVEGAPNAAQSLAADLKARHIGGLDFHPGVQMEELNLFLFILQLRPQRLAEMGGPGSLLPGDGCLLPLPWAEAVRPKPIFHEEEPVELDWQQLFAGDAPPAQAAPQGPGPEEAPAAVPAGSEAVGDPAPSWLPPSPAALAEELRPLFLEAVGRTSPVLRAGPHTPWDLDQRDALSRFGFAVPDCSGLAGFGARMDLDTMPPANLRDALRKALAGLEAFDQGKLLLGLPGFPPEEHALRRALDFLAPELLAQAVAHAHVEHQPSRFDLALLTVALMQCVHDRELSMEAIRGRLQFEGWGAQEVEELKEAVQWECHGTDTKLNLSLERHAIHEQDPHLIMTLGRQLIRARRMDDLRSLLGQLDEELDSPMESRRRHGAEVLGDLAVSMQETGLGQDLERRILTTAHERLFADTDDLVAQWCAQAVEAILGRWIATGQCHGVHDEMVALGGLAYPEGTDPTWKTGLVRALLARLASPANIALLLPILQGGEAQFPRARLHTILNLMGTPAASSLAGWLEFEEDPARRGPLADALQALGPRAVPVLKECLASPRGFMVEQALRLLALAGDPSALPGMLLALSHGDPAVRKAAVAAVSALAGRTAAARALVEALPAADTATRLEYLLHLSDLGDPVAVPAVLRLVQDTHAQGEDAQRVRLRAVETLGLIPSPEAVRPLQELFQKKGLFKGREPLSLRLSAAQALAAINSREAREAMALALESETQEEVRTVLKQYLVR